VENSQTPPFVSTKTMSNRFKLRTSQQLEPVEKWVEKWSFEDLAMLTAEDSFRVFTVPSRYPQLLQEPMFTTVFHHYRLCQVDRVDVIVGGHAPAGGDGLPNVFDQLLLDGRAKLRKAIGKPS
jgi:hypothetical protein